MFTHPPISRTAQLMLLSPLGERLGEGVMQETVFALPPSPNLSSKGSCSSPPWDPLRGRGWVRVMQEAAFALTQSPNLSPKGERNM